MLYTLGQYIVNVQSSTTSDGFSTIFIFGIWEPTYFMKNYTHITHNNVSQCLSASICVGRGGRINDTDIFRNLTKTRAPHTRYSMGKCVSLCVCMCVWCVFAYLWLGTKGQGLAYIYTFHTRVYPPGSHRDSRPYSLEKRNHHQVLQISYFTSTITPFCLFFS